MGGLNSPNFVKVEKRGGWATPAFGAEGEGDNMLNIYTSSMYGILKILYHCRMTIVWRNLVVWSLNTRFTKYSTQFITADQKYYEWAIKAFCKMVIQGYANMQSQCNPVFPSKCRDPRLAQNTEGVQILLNLILCKCYVSKLDRVAYVGWVNSRLIIYSQTH